MRCFTILLFMLAGKITLAQVIFEEHFNNNLFPANWSFSDKTELALSLGKENSNYVRFHPNFQNQSITTPTISAAAGNYTLFFEWNKARTQTPDSVQIQLSLNNGSSWETIYSIYDGNNRSWQKDSVALNNISSDLKIRWNYFSSGIFPAQYFNLDNVSIAKNISTSIRNNTNTIEVRVFPNPAQDAFQLQLKNPMQKNGTLHIYNTLGELVYQKNITSVLQTLYQIDVSNFSKGAYVIQLEFGDEQFSKTILVQ